MHSDLIGKIEKANRYAQEPERIAIDTLLVQFHGDNHAHTVALGTDGWRCDCRGFALRGVCEHMMSLQRILEPMLSTVALDPGPVIAHSDLIGMIEKSRNYAHQPDRIIVDRLASRFRGNNSEHALALADGRWTCSCNTFQMWNTCAHVMAIQKILDPMLAAPAREAGSVSVEDFALAALS